MFSILHNDWVNRSRPQNGWRPDLNHSLMDGCVLEMPFLEGAGEKTQDYSGKMNQGTLIGTGQKWSYSGGMKFNGSSDYINCGNPTDGRLDFTVNDFTVSVMSLAYALDSSRGTLSKGAPQNSTGKGYGISIGASGIVFGYLGDGLTGNKYINTNAATVHQKAGIPHQSSFVFRYNGTNWGGSRVFVNGKIAPSATLLSAVTGSVSALTDGANPFNIGRRGSSFGYWNGIIYYVRIHNRALSPDEVQSLAQNPWQAWRPAINRTYFAPLLLFGGVDPVYLRLGLVGSGLNRLGTARSRNLVMHEAGAGQAGLLPRRRKSAAVRESGSGSQRSRVIAHGTARAPIWISDRKTASARCKMLTGAAACKMTTGSA